MRSSIGNQAPTPSLDSARLFAVPMGEGAVDNSAKAMRRDVGNAMKCRLERLRSGEALGLDDIETDVVRVVEQVLANGRLMPRFQDLRCEPNHVFDHSVGVCVLSVILGIDLDYSYGDLEALATGAILHDLGKIFISDDILNLPRKLTDEEFTEVQKHPTLGFGALRNQLDLDIRAAHVAYQHHERMDGKGYPRGLAGEEIHRFARVVSVADVYDAVTSPRPYRDALPSSHAVQIIKEERGKAFDPAVVEAFARRFPRD